jgi:ferredoxin-NADP reductase/hemoglobin-like flavoprotein
MDAATAADGMLSAVENYAENYDGELLAEIRATFALIEPRAPQAAAWFYEHFFAHNPRYRKIFSGDPAVQQRRLYQAVSRIIADFDDLDAFLPYLRRLALRHRKFALRAAHYTAFNESMIATVEAFTGPAFTAHTRVAWEAGFGLVASVMQECAAEAEALAPPYWEAEVVEHELLAPEIARLRVRVLQDPDRPGPYHYRAGQYAGLESADNPRVWRDFSFASVDTDENLVDFHIQSGRTGGLSRLLVHETAVGARLRIAGAEGDLGFEPGAQRLVAVAHGTGAAPVAGLVQELVDEGDQRELCVVLVVEDPMPGFTAQHYLAEHFADLARRHGAMRVRTVPESRIGETAREVLAPEPAWQAAVLVGPSVLIDFCRAELVDAGTPPEAVATDQFD